MFRNHRTMASILAASLISMTPAFAQAAPVIDTMLVSATALELNDSVGYNPATRTVPVTSIGIDLTTEQGGNAFMNRVTLAIHEFCADVGGGQLNAGPVTTSRQCEDRLNRTYRPVVADAIARHRSTGAPLALTIKAGDRS